MALLSYAERDYRPQACKSLRTWSHHRVPPTEESPVIHKARVAFLYEKGFVTEFSQITKKLQYFKWADYSSQLLHLAIFLWHDQIRTNLQIKDIYTINNLYQKCLQGDYYYCAQGSSRKKGDQSTWHSGEFQKIYKEINPSWRGYATRPHNRRYGVRNFHNRR